MPDWPHPLLQLSIDLWKTITPNKFHIYIAQCTYIHGRLNPPPPPIENRSLENHYTKYVSYIAQCIYTHGRLTPAPHQLSIDALNTTTPNLADLMSRFPPSQLSIDALNTATLNLADLLVDLLTDLPITPSQSSIDALNTTTPNLADLLADLPQSIEHRCLEYGYTKLGRSTPQSIEHRCLEHHYTKLGRSTPCQLSIDALNTATLNLADLLVDLLTDLPITPKSIKHRCLEYHHTKLGRSTPSQLSIDPLNTTTPNLADLPPSAMHHGCILWDIFGSHCVFFKKRWEFAFISE